MIKLVYNEVTKIVAQRRFAAVIVFLAVVAIASGLFARNLHGPDTEDAMQLLSNGVSGAVSQLLFPFLFAVVIGDIVAGELTAGTMKLLLIRPVSRWKIWVSKLLGAYVVCIAALLFSGLCTYIALGAAVGFGSWSSPATGGIVQSAGLADLKAYGLEFISIFSVISVFLLLSTMVENGTAAVGLCVGLAFVCSVIVPISLLLKSNWVTYIFFEHWQVAQYAVQANPLPHWNLAESLLDLYAWSVLCITAGIALFQWKDVRG
jgi:ABC-2 type transport system permease protein